MATSPRSSRQFRTGKRTSSSQKEKQSPERSIQAIDAWFETAGLVHSRRRKGVSLSPIAGIRGESSETLRPAPAETTVAENGVEWVSSPTLRNLPWLWHGFATRRGGVSAAYTTEGAPGELNLGFTQSDDRANVIRNRELLAEAITGDPAVPIVTLRQIHSNVLQVTGTATDQPCKGDGLMTDKPGVLIGVQTADCVPVLVADKWTHAVAAFHAGWRGTVKRIVENGIGRMRLEFGSRPQDLVAAIGPSIGPCCFEIGEEVLSEFESQFTYARELFHEVHDTDAVRMKFPMLFMTQRAPGHSKLGPSLHLNLFEANRRQLVDAGLKAKNIQIVGGCTRCQQELFFSHRGSQGHCGRMLSVIGRAK